MGLASGDHALSEHCIGLLERREEVSRAWARLARQGLFELAPRLRRRASVTVLHLPPALLEMLEADEQLVRTGSSAAGPYGWHALSRGQPWALDAYLRLPPNQGGSPPAVGEVAIRLPSDAGRRVP